MTLDQIITYLSILSAIVLGLGNWYTLSKRNVSLETTDIASNSKILNEAVTLANQRALAAEKQYYKLQEEYDLLEKRILTLERSLSYRISFDVVLGTKPSIERSEIVHVLERRVKEAQVDIERRKPQ